jgi:hypothetical protein
MDGHTFLHSLFNHVYIKPEQTNRQTQTDRNVQHQGSVTTTWSVLCGRRFFIEGLRLGNGAGDWDWECFFSLLNRAAWPLQFPRQTGILGQRVPEPLHEVDGTHTCT